MDFAPLAFAGLIATVPGLVGALVLWWVRGAPDARSIELVRRFFVPHQSEELRAMVARADAVKRKAELVEQLDGIKQTLSPSSTAIVRLHEVADEAVIQALNKALAAQAEQA